MRSSRRKKERLRESLFGQRKVAEVVIGYGGTEPAGFAVFFHNYSTFLGRPGLYPVPQNAPHVSAGMNVLNLPEGQSPKATDVSPWYGVYVEDLFVSPEWRGRGLGRRLLAYVADLAVKRRCGRLEWAVLDWNEPAIRFYESLEAQRMEEWTVYRLTGDALKRLATEFEVGKPT